jgi:putative endonuclease
MTKGFMYILICNDGTYYTGSTKYLLARFDQHQKGKGANHTKKRLPIELVYYEEFTRIDWAFNREKQIQGWSHDKKRALVEGKNENLPLLAECKNKTHFKFRKLRGSNKK